MAICQGTLGRGQGVGGAACLLWRNAHSAGFFTSCHSVVMTCRQMQSCQAHYVSGFSVQFRPYDDVGRSDLDLQPVQIPLIQSAPTLLLVSLPAHKHTQHSNLDQATELGYRLQVQPRCDEAQELLA